MKEFEHSNSRHSRQDKSALNVSVSEDEEDGWSPPSRPARWFSDQPARRFSPEDDQPAPVEEAWGTSISRHGREGKSALNVSASEDEKDGCSPPHERLNRPRESNVREVWGETNLDSTQEEMDSETGPTAQAWSEAFSNVRNEFRNADLSSLWSVPRDVRGRSYSMWGNGLPPVDSSSSDDKKAEFEEGAGYPELQRQIENLKHLSGWDENTTALLKMVAGKLHANEEIDAHLFDELAAFDGYKKDQGVPAHFQKLFQQVAAELERDPRIYQALLLNASVDKAVALPPARDSALAAARMLSDMTWKVLHKVVQKLVVEAIPIQGLKNFRTNYEELRNVYLGNYTPQGRLEALSHALESLGKQLAQCGNQFSQTSPELKKALVALQGYLAVVTPWLNEVSRQWQMLEHGIHQLQNNESALGKAVDLLALIDTLLSAPQVQAFIGKDRLDNIGQGLSAVRQMLGQVRLLQALPDDTGLSGYLDILATNPLIRKALDDSTLKLAQVLASVREGYPSKGSLAEKMTWLASTLVDPVLRERLQPHLEMVLADKSQADQLFATFQFIGQLRFFPTDSSLGGQALWLLTLLSQSTGDSPALAWIKNFQSALGADPATLMLLNRLLTLDGGTASWTELMRDIAKNVAPSAGLLAARTVAGTLLPPEVTRQLEKFYQESSATESWGGMCKRMASSMMSILKPHAVAALMGDPLAAVTVHYAEAIQKHQSFDETLRWFVANDPSQDKTLQFAYSQYLNAMLVWQVYQAFNSKTPEETEATLRQLAGRLKDYQIVKSYPQLEKLIDLIPLLPALKEARHAVGAQPPADTWLDWSNQWLDALADSKSTSMLELREQLSRKIENWLADAVMSAGSLLYTSVPPWDPIKLLPSVAGDSVAPVSPELVAQAFEAEDQQTAAALFAQLTSEQQARFTTAHPDGIPQLAGGGTQPTIGATTSAPSAAAASGSGAIWGLLGAGISLEALGVGAIAYALWRARQAGKAEPLRSEEIGMALLDASPVPQGDSVESGLIAKEAPDIVPSVGKRLWDQKIPLLLGVMAMATGVGLMSSGIARALAKRDSEHEKEYKKALETFEEFQVPDLSFLFYDELSEENISSPVDTASLNTHEPPPHDELSEENTSSPVDTASVNAHEEAPAEAQSRRVKRAATSSVTSATIPEHIEQLLRETGLKEFMPIKALFFKATLADEVKLAEKNKRPQAEINVIKLLKSIEYYAAIKEIYASEIERKCRPVLEGLWVIANGLSDEYGQTKVREYKAAFLIGNPSTIRSESIPELITKAINNAGVADNDWLPVLQHNIEQSLNVNGAPEGPTRNVALLLEYMREVSAFTQHLSGATKKGAIGQAYDRLLDALWEIANNLSDRDDQTRVSEYKQALGGTSRPPLVTTATTATTAPSTTTTARPAESTEGRMKRSAVDTLQQLEALNSPILDLSGFIDDYIKKGIHRFEEQTGTRLYLQPDTLIPMTVSTQVFNDNFGRKNGGEKYIRKVVATPQYSLKDIVTGQHLYKLNLIVKSNTTRRVTFSNPDVEALVNWFKRDNLETVMEKALATYRSDSANKIALTSHYQKMIRLRCVEYLESPNKIPAYQQAVEDFLTGNIQAREVSFKGSKLNGVFWIPSGRASGVLFSVDEPGFFHVSAHFATFEETLFSPQITVSVASFPQTSAFKDWVLHKIPGNKSYDYKNKPVSMFQSHLRRDRFSNAAREPGGTPFVDHPFTFTPTGNQGDLANKLFDGLMARLESDIDTAVFSPSEQRNEFGLEIAKTIFMLAAVVLNVAVPGTGSVLSRIGLFLGNLALDAAYVTAAAMQAHLADRPEDAAAYRNEAIIAGILGGLGTAVAGKALTREGIMAARNLYRQAKFASGNIIPAALGKVNWIKLGDPKKIDLLFDTMQKSGQATKLTRLTRPGVVTQSIRRNLELDAEGVAKTSFNWNEDFAIEQTRAEGLLDADLTRLNEANEQMQRILEAPPTVTRNLLPEKNQEGAAAAWIARRGYGVNGGELKIRIERVLSDNKDADLLEITTIDRIHEALSPPAAGAAARTFRPSGGPKLMGSDIARDGFEKVLADIKLKVEAGTVTSDKLGDVLYAAIMRYQPYVKGNGETARTLYALTQLKRRETYFESLTADAEHLLGEAVVPRVPPPAESVGIAAPAVETRRVIADSPATDLPGDMRDYLGELKKDSEVLGIISQPNDNCFDCLVKIRKFMQDKGMQDIKVRKMLIWSSPHNTPSPHYVLKGSKDGKEFIFDLTAGQFQDTLPTLDGPLILPEPAWAKRYQTASQTNTKLMKYKDFDSIPEANKGFGGRAVDREPTDVLDGAYVLTEPRWYKVVKSPEHQVAKSFAEACVELGGRRSRRAPCIILDVNEFRTTAKASTFIGSAKFKEIKEELITKLGAGTFDEARVKSLLVEYATKAKSGNDAFKNLTNQKLTAFLVDDLSMSASQARYMTAAGWKTAYVKDVNRLTPAASRYWENLEKQPARINVLPPLVDQEQIAVYRTMERSEAEALLAGESLDALGNHLGDVKQASSYFTKLDEQVLMKFTLKPGSHMKLFDIDTVATAPAGDPVHFINAVVNARSPLSESVTLASKSEGMQEGFIGIKSENRGEGFSLAIPKGNSGIQETPGRNLEARPAYYDNLEARKAYRALGPREKLATMLERGEVVWGPSELIGKRFLPQIETPLARLKVVKLGTIADLKRIDEASASNRVLWHDDWAGRIVDRNSQAIKAKIDEMVKEVGGLENYKALTGTDPYAKTNPVCGTSAQNIFKLMTEGATPINPIGLPKKMGTSFEVLLSEMKPEKSYVVIVNDKRLGHKYLVDLPGNVISAEGHRPAFVMQSDLGDGVLQPLAFTDWMSMRGADAIPLTNFKTLYSPDFVKLTPQTKSEILASTLDIEKDPSRLRIEKLKAQESWDFVVHEYDPVQYKKNLNEIDKTDQQWPSGSALRVAR